MCLSFSLWKHISKMVPRKSWTSETEGSFCQERLELRICSGRWLCCVEILRGACPSRMCGCCLFAFLWVTNLLSSADSFPRSLVGLEDYSWKAGACCLSLVQPKPQARGEKNLAKETLDQKGLWSMLWRCLHGACWGPGTVPGTWPLLTHSVSKATNEAGFVRRWGDWQAFATGQQGRAICGLLAPRSVLLTVLLKKAGQLFSFFPQEKPWTILTYEL